MSDLTRPKSLTYGSRFAVSKTLAGYQITMHDAALLRFRDRLGHELDESSRPASAVGQGVSWTAAARLPPATYFNPRKRRPSASPMLEIRMTFGWCNYATATASARSYAAALSSIPGNVLSGHGRFNAMFRARFTQSPLPLGRAC